METNERVYVHAREIGGACLTEVESVGRLRVSSRGHRSAFLRIVALARRANVVVPSRRISYGPSQIASIAIEQKWRL